MNIKAKKQKWAKTSTRQKRKLLNDALSILSLDPEAAALLELARKDGVRIGFTAALIGKDMGGSYSFGQKRLRLSPDGAYDEIGLAGTIAHELRHHWQYKRLGVRSLARMRRDPHVGFLLNRTMEADAFAFEEIMLDRVLDQLKWMLETGKDEKRLRPIDAATMKKYFQRHLKKLSAYDKEESLALTFNHMATEGRKEMRRAGPALTIADVRKITAGYIKGTDAQFDALIMQNANKKAKRTLTLVEAFNTAVAKKQPEDIRCAAKKLTRIVRHDMKIADSRQ